MIPAVKIKYGAFCQSYEKYLHDVAAGKEIKKQNYKCFVTQRAKEVDTRSFCKKGYGGNPALTFCRSIEGDQMLIQR